MPINATLGSTLQFTVVFFDSANVITVPSSATLTVTYPLSSNSLTTTSCAIGMTAVGDFFTCTWGSGVAAPGLSSYAVTGAGQSGVLSGTTGTVKLIS